MDLAVSKILYKKKYFWFKALSNSCNSLASGWFATLFIYPGIGFYLKEFNWLNFFILIQSFIFGVIFLVLSVFLDKK
ncbi:conserved hypothetical protein [Candidatus Roizmanbacteria bacterium]|nr:conserved hypothetical protein [Candidatus Roizmanbacteria bacterium]